MRRGCRPWWWIRWCSSPVCPRWRGRQFEALAPRLQSTRVNLREVYVDAYESGVIAAALDRVAAAHPPIDNGSNPQFDAAGYKVKLTVESSNGTAVLQAFEALLSALPPGSVVRQT